MASATVREKFNLEHLGREKPDTELGFTVRTAVVKLAIHAEWLLHLPDLVPLLDWALGTILTGSRQCKAILFAVRKNDQQSLIVVKTVCLCSGTFSGG